MKNIIRIKRYLLILISSIAMFFGLLPASIAYADTEFSVSPMKQKIILMPGEAYEGSFGVINPVSNDKTFNFKLSVMPFTANGSNGIIFENDEDYNQIVNWIELESESGSVEPNETKTIHFKIKVPQNAPAGGQYASIIVTGNDVPDSSSDNINVQNVLAISHLVFAEVAGTIEKGGDIVDIAIPGFLFSGNISATSVIKNTGNVHGAATYTLQVFPLFSSEEIYTNEENPEEHIVMPNNEYLNTIHWDATPQIGIFNVVYTVEFEGLTKQITQLVIVCPMWLIFIIVLIIVALIVWIVVRVKMRKKAED